MQRYKVMIGSAFYTEAALSFRRVVGVKNNGHISWPSNRLIFDTIMYIESGVNDAIQDKS